VSSLFIQQGDQRFADPQFHNGGFRVKLRIGPEGLRSCLNGFLVPRGEGAQGMLYPVAQLAEYGIRDIKGILGDKIDPDPFGADQAHNLFDPVFQYLGEIFEKEVRLIEEEYDFRFRRVANPKLSKSSARSQSRNEA
jgi:hypothetical protein